MADQIQPRTRWGITTPKTFQQVLASALKASAQNMYSHVRKSLKGFMPQFRSQEYLEYGRIPTERLPPIQLPPKRKRALSINSVPKLAGWTILSLNNQRTSPQYDCLFLQKLPPEIRNQIYCEVLGDRVLHIIPGMVPSRTRPARPFLKRQLVSTVFSRLDYEPCKWTNETNNEDRSSREHRHGTCAIWINKNGNVSFNPPKTIWRGECDIETKFLRWWSQKNRVLALLKTCRQMYELFS